MKECSSRLAKLDQTAWGKLRSCAVLTGKKDGQSNVQRTTKVPASNQEEESSNTRGGQCYQTLPQTWVQFMAGM